MNGNTYLILLAVFLLVIIPWITRRRKLAAVRHILNQKKQNKENREMKELAKRFIGEACIIYTITSNDGSVQGVIKEIDDGGMVIEKKTGELEIVNLDFVTRIREYPRKKNGRKKRRPKGLLFITLVQKYVKQNVLSEYTTVQTDTFSV